LGSGVTIRVANIFPLGGTLAGISKVWIEAEQEFLGGFIFFPNSDSAVNGWWFPTEETETREVKAGIYYLDYRENKEYHKPNALYTYDVNKPENNRFYRDLTLHSGNQFFIRGGSVLSWWHSSCGDGPIDFLGYGDSVSTKCIRTPCHYRDNTFFAIRLAYCYSPSEDTTYNLDYLPLAIFKNGKKIWSTGSDIGIIGGVYQVSTERMLIFVVEEYNKAVLYDAKRVIVIPPSWTNTAVETFVCADNFTPINRFNLRMRWPWRFNSLGTECVTIVENTNLKYPELGEGYGVYTSYEIWTIGITYNAELDSYSASLVSNVEYVAKSLISGTSVVDYTNGGGSPNYNSRITDYSTTTDLIEGYEKIPYAVTYDANDEIVVAWLDFTGTSSEYDLHEELYLIPYDPNNTANGSSVSSNNSTTKKTLLIGSDSFDLELTSEATSSEVTEDFNAIGISAEIDLTESRSGYRYIGMLYVDINNRYVVPYYGYSTEISKTISDSDYVSWGDTGSLTGTSSYEFYKRISLLTTNDSIYFLNTETTDSIVASFPVDPDGTYQYYEIILLECSDSGDVDEDVEQIIYYSSSDNTRQVAYGFAVDGEGNYVFSFDWPETDDIYGTTLDRETGNFSNIENFDTDVVATVSGDNKLLFPIGQM
jgi:hypothetical protein